MSAAHRYIGQAVKTEITQHQYIMFGEAIGSTQQIPGEILLDNIFLSSTV